MWVSLDIKIWADNTYVVLIGMQTSDSDVNRS